MPFICFYNQNKTRTKKNTDILSETQIDTCKLCSLNLKNQAKPLNKFPTFSLNEKKNNNNFNCYIKVEKQ